jgi:hypothetical protein
MLDIFGQSIFTGEPFLALVSHIAIAGFYCNKDSRGGSLFQT